MYFKTIAEEIEIGQVSFKQGQKVVHKNVS